MSSDDGLNQQVHFRPTLVQYTKYDIECYMVFRITMVTFRFTLLMNK